MATTTIKIKFFKLASDEIPSYCLDIQPFYVDGKMEQYEVIYKEKTTLTVVKPVALQQYIWLFANSIPYNSSKSELTQVDVPGFPTMLYRAADLTSSYQEETNAFQAHVKAVITILAEQSRWPTVAPVLT